MQSPGVGIENWFDEQAQGRGGYLDSKELETFMVSQLKKPEKLWVAGGTLRELFIWRGMHRSEPRTEISSAPSHLARPEILRLSKAGLQLARQSALRDLDNAYFPLCEAVCWMTLGKREQVFAAIARAGKCARFNDYLTSGPSRRLEIQNAQQSMVWEERWEALTRWEDQRSYAFEALALDLSVDGRAAFRGGRTAAAFRYFEAGLTVGRCLRKSTTHLEINESGHRVATQVWLNAVSRSRAKFRELDDYRWKREARDYQIFQSHEYAAFARANNRPDLAKQALLDLEDFFPAAIGGYGYDPHQPMDPAIALGAVRGSALMANLVSLSWVCAGVCAVLAGLVALSSNFPRPRPKAVADTALFLHLAVLAAAGMAAWFELDFIQRSDRTYFSGLSITNPFVTPLFLIGSILLGTAPIALWWRSSFYHGFKFRLALPRKRPVISKELGLIIVLWGVGFLLWGLPSLYPGMAAIEGMLSQLPLPFGLSYYSLILLCTSILCAALGLTARASYRAFRQKFAPNRVKILGWMIRAPRFVFSVAGTLALSFSFAYLVIAIAVWPFRAFMENFVDDYERRGEITLLKERGAGLSASLSGK